MNIETLERHATIAFDLMVGLRHDQSSQAYIHAAKAWMHLDSEVRKAKREEKKAAKAATPDIAPVPVEETTDKAPKPAPALKR